MPERKIKLGDVYVGEFLGSRSPRLRCCYVILSGEQKYEDGVLGEWFWRVAQYVIVESGFLGAGVKDFTEDELSVLQKVDNIESILEE